jgi:hypothetical protein
VWINDQHLGLEYGCQRCLEGDQPAGEEPKARVITPRIGRRRYRRRA